MVSVLCCREEQFERLSADKLAAEERAAEQAESLRQLSDANCSQCHGCPGRTKSSHYSVGARVGAASRPALGDQPRPD